jgi:hypothetical protein
MKNRFSYWWLVGCMAFLTYACDIINKDTRLVPTPGEPNGTVLYTTPKNGVVMNLLTMDEYKNASGFRIASQPQNGTVSFVKDATLMYTPDTTKNITFDSFVLSVTTDSVKNTTELDTIVVKFVPVDSIPCITGVIADAYITQPNVPVQMSVLENDYFCQGTLDSTSLAIVKATEHGTLQIRNKRVVYTPNANYEGYDFFVYRVCNSNGQCGEAPVKLLVTRPGSTICDGIMPDSYTFAQDSTASHVLNLFANDSFCGDSINYGSFTIVSQPQHGTVSIGKSIPPVISYRHSYGFSGTDTFRYRICSNSGKCSEADVKIYIVPDSSNCRNRLVNDTLSYQTVSATDSVYTTGTNFNVLQNDKLDCPIVTIYELTVSKQPTNGKAKIAGGQLVYLANPGFKGTDTVEYGVCIIGNSQSCTERATVGITIK